MTSGGRRDRAHNKQKQNVVTTKEQLQAAGDKFRAADVDLVIRRLLTYATSYNMLPKGFGCAGCSY